VFVFSQNLSFQIAAINIYELHTGNKTFLECASLGTIIYQGGCSDEENWDLSFVLVMPHPGEKPHLLSRQDVEINILFMAFLGAYSLKGQDTWYHPM